MASKTNVSEAFECACSDAPSVAKILVVVPDSRC